MGDNVSKVIDQCLGCGACEAVCPLSCVSMEESLAGFRSSIVEEARCISCKKCVSVCPALVETNPVSKVDVYWAQHMNAELLGKSSSGGVFYALARNVIRDKGIVVGAAFKVGCLEVEHILVSNEADLKRLMSSKYLQSELGQNVYNGVAQGLSEGKKVLFSGVGCQVAALRGYLAALNIPQELLLCVEVACHGVPSPMLWKKWLGEKAKPYGSDSVKKVSFRRKQPCWNPYSVDIVFRNGAHLIELANANWYMKAFVSGLSIRSTCADCSFKQASGSDLVLADFWGAENYGFSIDYNAGVSGVVVNTKKGETAFLSACENLCYGPSSLDDLARCNPCVVGPPAPNADNKLFLRDVEQLDITCLTRTWPMADSLKTRLGRVVRYLPFYIRVMIGKILLAVKRKGD